MVNQSLKSYLEPRSISLGFGIGGALLAVVALYWIFLLQLQSPDGQRSVVQDVDSGEANVLEDLDSFLAVNSSGDTSALLQKTQLYEFLQKTSENRLAALLRQSADIEESPWRRTTQDSTLRRLTAINPRKALNLASSYPREERKWMVESVFSEWSLVDLSGAATTGLKLDGVDRDLALRSILLTRTDLPKNRRIAIGRQFAREELARRIVLEESSQILTDNPGEAWRSAMESERDLIPVFDLLVGIAEKWVESDGISVLGPLLDSLEDRLGADVLAEQVISTVAQDDPSGTFAQVLAIPNQREALSRLIGNWAKSDGIAALDSVTSVEDYETRRDLIFVVMRRWAEQDAESLFESRNLFPPEVLLEVLNLSIGKIARRDSQKAMELVENLRSEGVITWTVENSLVEASASIDPGLTLDWLETRTSAENPYRPVMLRTTIAELARRDPTLAMEAALNQPIDDLRGPIEVAVIEIVSKSDIDRAIELLEQVRDEGVRDSFQHVGRALVAERRPLEALELGKKMHEEQRDVYYGRILQIWAYSNPEQLLNGLQDLPTDHVRSLAALSLFRINADRPVFNSDQMEYVESQLSQEHLDELSD
ncbi:MAG: hypothetical protein F4X44_01980 [Gammaproteobacteria bacterium]|nr:hypothetical protein [Gammaproteobacteria bacterium]MYD79365.1 hypothetical protein [Gammaproteobacteria bacterium]